MLQKVKFAPGFNKQVTATGGESQWVAGDNVRFRYGTPEKIGGWSQLGSVAVTGRMLCLEQTEFYTHTQVVYFMTYIHLNLQQH